MYGRDGGDHGAAGAGHCARPRDRDGSGLSARRKLRFGDRLHAARFAVSGINVGLFCSTPAVALSRNVAPKHAFEMLATGRFIDAATAADWGLVNDAVPESKLDDRVAALVGDIEAKSAAALRHGKALFYAQQEVARSDAYRLAAEVMAQNMMEDDAAQGIAAFLEKRRPR